MSEFTSGYLFLMKNLQAVQHNAEEGNMMYIGSIYRKSFSQ